MDDLTRIKNGRIPDKLNLIKTINENDLLPEKPINSDEANAVWRDILSKHEGFKKWALKLIDTL